MADSNSTPEHETHTPWEITALTALQALGDAPELSSAYPKPTPHADIQRSVEALGLQIDEILGERQQLLTALKALRIDANRICDRNLGGTYEDDCRRSIAMADAAIARCERGR